MLPPVLSTPIMDNNSTKIQSLITEQPAYRHHKSTYFLNNAIKNNISNSSSSLTSSSSSISTNSFPTIPFNTSSIKHFFNKTLANVAQTNLSNYAAEYSSTTLNSSAPNISSNSYAIASEVYDGLVNNQTTASSSVGTLEVSSAFDSYAALSNGSHHLETTTAFPTAQTVATFIAGNKNRATTIIVYPTVSPESIVIPIVSCIFGFPILAFIVICCLRHRAKLARERDRRRNYDMQDHAVSLVRFSPIHRLNYRSTRAISLRPERSLSQGFTSLELDTVVEERCSDVEQTQTEVLNPESPMESSTTSCKVSFSSS